MNTTLIEILQGDLKPKITPEMIRMFHRYVVRYEILPNNSAAIGSPLLGVSAMYFLPRDNQALFELCDISPTEFKRACHSATEINPSFKISSDPYNLLTIFLLHLTHNTPALSARDKNQFSMDLLKMLHYKFFTSVTNHNLQHGATEDVMQYTIDQLSNKFQIKVVGSWKKVIEVKCEDILSKHGIHKKTIHNFSPDKGVVDMLSDIQTRIRKQIVAITRLYYINKEEGRGIAYTSLVDSIGDDKVLKSIDASMDVMITGVSSSSTNLSEFLDYEYIEIAASLTNEVTPELLTRLLTKFSEMAEAQSVAGTKDLQKGTKRSPVYIGYNVLIGTLLQKTYRLCSIDKDVDMRSKVAILKKARNIYSSSRTSDDDILAIKDSIKRVIIQHSDSKRNATNSSLRISFILYLILRSFRFTGY